MKQLMHELTNLYQAFTKAENEDIKKMWENKWYERVYTIQKELEKEQKCD